MAIEDSRAPLAKEPSRPFVIEARDGRVCPATHGADALIIDPDPMTVVMAAHERGIDLLAVVSIGSVEFAHELSVLGE
jgi:hypothetical protein